MRGRRWRAELQSRRTSGSPSLAGLRAMDRPTAIMTTPNRASSFSPSNALPAVDPMAAPMNAEDGEGDRTAKLDVAGPEMGGEVERRVQRDGEGACADRHVRILDPDQIDEERNGEHRPAATDEAERETDKPPRQERQNVLREGHVRSGLPGRVWGRAGSATLGGVAGALPRHDAAGHAIGFAIGQSSERCRVSGSSCAGCAQKDRRSVGDIRRAAAREHRQGQLDRSGDALRRLLVRLPNVDEDRPLSSSRA